MPYFNSLSAEVNVRYPCVASDLQYVLSDPIIAPSDETSTPELLTILLHQVLQRLKKCQGRQPEQLSVLRAARGRRQ